MNVNITWATAKNWIREVASIVGLVVSIGGYAHLPSNVNTALLAVSGWLQVTQHKLDAASAAASPAAPTSPTTPAG